MSGKKRAPTPEEVRIEEAIPVIDAVARDIARDFPSADPDDLASVGKVKLATIASKFDPAIQNDFRAFYYLPVTGAMMNAAINEAELSSRERALAQMDHEHGLTTEAAKDLMAEIFALDTAPSSKKELKKYIQLRAAGFIWTGTTLAPPDGEEALLKREAYLCAVRCLRRKYESLDARTRLVLDGLYVKGLTNDQVGATLPKPLKGREVQRIHGTARDAFRAALAAEGIFDAPEVIDP